jgi:KRAB domain-containing zinc finger protein
MIPPHITAPLAPTPFYCRYCHFVVQDSTRLQEHMQSLHPFICLQCNKAFATKSGMSKHEKKHHGEVEDLVQCHICLQRFVHDSELRHHMIRHSEQRLHTCTVCKKAYKHKESLQKHKCFL